MVIAGKVSHSIMPGVQVGDEVGYMIRFDRAVSAKTRITLMTDGMILREMLSDPLLTKYSVILVDDVHRRVLMAQGGSVCSKLLLIHITYYRYIWANLCRPDLGLVDADRSEKAFIFQHLSRSTLFTRPCTA